MSSPSGRSLRKVVYHQPRDNSSLGGTSSLAGILHYTNIKNRDRICKCRKPEFHTEAGLVEDKFKKQLVEEFFNRNLDATVCTRSDRRKIYRQLYGGDLRSRTTASISSRISSPATHQDERYSSLAGASPLTPHRTVLGSPNNVRQVDRSPLQSSTPYYRTVTPSQITGLQYDSHSYPASDSSHMMGIWASANFQQPQQAYTLVERPATLQGPLDFHHSQMLPPRIVTVTPSSIRAKSCDSPTGASSALISAQGPGSQATGHSRRENTLLPASHLDGTEGMLHDVELNSDFRNGRQAEKVFYRAFERVRAWNRDHQKGLTNYELETLTREFVAEHEAQSTRHNAARMVQDNHRSHDSERQIPDRVLDSSSAAMDSAGRSAPAARYQATAESISDSLDSSTEFFEKYDGPGVMDYSRSDEKPGASLKRHDSSAREQKSSPSRLNMDSFSAEISKLESHIGRSSFNPWDTSNEDTSLMHMLNRTPNHAFQEEHASPVEHSNRKRVTFAESNVVEPHRAQTSVSSQRTRTPPQGSCALCKVPYTLNRRRAIYTLECGHSMHRDCLTDHFRVLDRNNEFCPIPGCEVFLCEASRNERVAADQKAIFGNQHTRVGPLFVSVNFDDGYVAQCKSEESLVTAQLHLLRMYLKKHVNSAWQTSLERRKSDFDFYQIVQDTVRDFSDVVLRSPSKYLPCRDVLLRFVAWAELTRLMNNRQSAVLRHEQNTIINTMFPPLRSLHDEFHRSKLIYDEQKVTWSRNQEGTLDCERVADFSYGLAMKSFQRPSQSQ